MESLPEEMLEHISQYMAPADLASCCSVSRGWREMFGKDRLWRFYCDKSLPEYLEVSRCVVQPYFVSPESEDSTLSAVSEWRLNYMKEIHLRNNWSLGNFVRRKYHFENQTKEPSDSVAYKNDYFLTFRKSEVEVWDVSKVMPICRAKHPFKNVSDTTRTKVCSLSHKNGTDSIVVVDGLVVRVFSLCCTTYNLQLLHVFSFEMPEESCECTDEAALALQRNKETRTRYAVVENLFVGVTDSLRQTPVKLHIWNVETGQKLREEDCTFIQKILPYTWYSMCYCEKNKNIVLEGMDEVDGKRFVHWYVYSLTRLMFYPFHKVEELQDSGVFLYGLYSVIFDKYIAIYGTHTLYVYNFLTSELLYSTFCYRLMFPFKNYAVFDSGPSVCAVNLCHPTAEINLNVNISYGRLGVVGNLGFISRSKVLHFSDPINCSTFTIKEGSNQISVPLWEVSCECDNFVNQTGTKLVMRDDTYTETKLIVVHFW